MYKYDYYCRWCGHAYNPLKTTDRDGFCCFAHKQAHYRAYKKYVTAKSHVAAGPRGKRVTQKKRKKWGCAYCNIANPAKAKFCVNCKKPKKVGSPFSLRV